MVAASLPFGPCTGWITGDDVADCCDVETTDGSIFDAVADQASQLLFQLSGRQFAGACSRTVVACEGRACMCNFQVLSRGHVIGPWDWGYWNWNGCWLWPCGHPSLVKLAGYPVRDVSEVKIDGVALDPSKYLLLDDHRHLARLDGDRWPFCDTLRTVEAQELNTVTYDYGQDPPEAGIAAAQQLACELYKQCIDQACALPKGTTQATRQGITIDKSAFIGWAFQEGRVAGRTRGWHTGMTLVDGFLNSVNPADLKRRPVFWSPSITNRYARPIGTW